MWGGFSAGVSAAVARAQMERDFLPWMRCLSRPSLGMLGGVQDLPASLACVWEKVGHVS